MSNLEMKGNSRQVPNHKQICANKKYYDILYAYLQCISTKDKDNRRFISKKSINFSQLGAKFGLTRQTISTKFKNLKEMGLIRDANSEQYELITLDKDLAMLVQYDTLKILVDALNENSISVYVYLLERYFANESKPYTFTLDQIKTRIGVSTTTRSNNDIITNILFVLQKIGLIKYSLTTMSQEEDTFANIKTIYQLDWLTNDLTKQMEC